MSIKNPVTIRHHHCNACVLENFEVLTYSNEAVALLAAQGLTIDNSGGYQDIPEDRHHPEEWSEVDPNCRCPRCVPQVPA